MNNSRTIEAEGLTYPEWQKPLQEALLELDRELLRTRMIEAKAAISNRLQAISGDVNHHDEKLAIRDALALLRMLDSEDQADRSSEAQLMRYGPQMGFSV